MALDVALVLTQWEQFGVFDFVLPFLLLFAVIFGIASSTKAFGENKAVHMILAVVVSLMAIQLPFVRAFFPEIFSRLGVALAVMVVFWILVMSFVTEDNDKPFVSKGFWALGAIVGLIVVFQTFNELSFFGSNWWQDWGALLIGGMILVGIIAAVGFGTKDKPATGR